MTPPLSDWLSVVLGGSVCPGCRRPLSDEAVVESLCLPCYSFLRPRKIVRADGICAVLVYRGLARSLILALKFGRAPQVARPLAQAIAVGLGRQLLGTHRRRPSRNPPNSPRSGFDAIVPIPLHPTRRRQRGYNQAERLARRLSASTAIPVWSQALRRNDPVAPRTLGGSLGTKRLPPAIGPGPTDVMGKRLLLLDDVVTTGQTLQAAQAVLRRRGAASVVAVAVCHVVRGFHDLPLGLADPRAVCSTIARVDAIRDGSIGVDAEGLHPTD